MPKEVIDLWKKISEWIANQKKKKLKNCNEKKGLRKLKKRIARKRALEKECINMKKWEKEERRERERESRREIDKNKEKFKVRAEAEDRSLENVDRG